MTAYHEDLSCLTIKNRSIYQKTPKQKGNKKIFSYILLSFSFMYASFYHKSEHKNFLDLIIYSIEAIMISEF